MTLHCYLYIRRRRRRRRRRRTLTKISFLQSTQEEGL
jgi:hypothetical protein